MSPRIPTRLLAAQTDERLVSLVRQGHDRAFEVLVQRYRRPLLRYSQRLLFSEARAEDVLQQALLRAWIALRRGAEVKDLKAWLYRIVHNTAVNTMRDSAGERDWLDEVLGGTAGEHSLGAATGGAHPSIDEVFAVRDTLTAMASLPPLQREVMVRTAVAGYSHEEVASALGITDGAVRGLLYRARATLRAAATAITPPPLIAWAVGETASRMPSPTQVAELAAGGGAVGLGSVLVKGGVVAVTAGALLTGAVVHPSQHPRPPKAHTQSASLPRLSSPTGGSHTVSAGGASAGVTLSSTSKRSSSKMRSLLRNRRPAHPRASAHAHPGPLSSPPHTPANTTTGAPVVNQIVAQTPTSTPTAESPSAPVSSQQGGQPGPSTLTHTTPMSAGHRAPGRASTGLSSQASTQSATRPSGSVTVASTGSGASATAALMPQDARGSSASTVRGSQLKARRVLARLSVHTRRGSMTAGGSLVDPVAGGLSHPSGPAQEGSTQGPLPPGPTPPSSTTASSTTSRLLTASPLGPSPMTANTLTPSPLTPAPGAVGGQGAPAPTLSPAAGLSQVSEAGVERRAVQLPRPSPQSKVSTRIAPRPPRSRG